MGDTEHITVSVTAAGVVIMSGVNAPAAGTGFFLLSTYQAPSDQKGSSSGDGSDPVSYLLSCEVYL